MAKKRAWSEIKDRRKESNYREEWHLVVCFVGFF